MVPEPGSVLDEIVARRLGDTGTPPPCSTDSAAAQRLCARLESSGVFPQFEQVGGLWYCVLWIEIGWVRERLATGSGLSQALALCRAVVNLPLNARLVSSGKTAPAAQEPGRVAGRKSGACLNCGAPLPPERSSLLCAVCGDRLGRPAPEDRGGQSPTRKHSGPDRPGQ